MDPLIKDGYPFSAEEVGALGAQLDALNVEERVRFRDSNSAAIALHPGARMLVVSGPGTGKSFMFRSRLKVWLNNYPKAQMEVATFVRKLVHDLRAEIANDKELTDSERKRVSVNTLHKLARSIVEQNHGSAGLRLRQHVRMAGGEANEEMIWEDVLCLDGEARPEEYPWTQMQAALYDAEPPTQTKWSDLRKLHLELQQYLNALTFPDLILLAGQAAAESPELVSGSMFVIDEFQDFNLAEDRLIRVLTAEAAGLLLVGDDDQVLYDGLRRSHPSIIRQYYQDRGFVNAMLPYCSRCGFHIAKAAEAFLIQGRPLESISKVFLPLKVEGGELVRVVASTSPGTGVDYIERFLEEHHGAIAERQGAIDAGDEMDPYLLILTPANRLRFLIAGGARERLLTMLEPLMRSTQRPEDDYWRVRDYYLCALEPEQSYGMRKVLMHEQMTQEKICEVLRDGMASGRPLAGLGDPEVGEAIGRCLRIREILEAEMAPLDQASELSKVIDVVDVDRLAEDLERLPIAEQPEEDEAHAITESQVSAVQLVSIVGSKGMSADHVIVLGCDQATLASISRSAFFVAMTRAKESLTLMACIGGGGAQRLHDFAAGLPDEHVDASQAMAHAATKGYETLQALQNHLDTIQLYKQKPKTPGA